MNILTRWLAPPALFAIAACASVAPPKETLQSATAATSAAEAVGAEDSPRAKFHLQLAREQIEAAEHLIETGEPVRAREALERARVDADLARALAEEQTTLAEAERV